MGLVTGRSKGYAETYSLALADCNAQLAVADLQLLVAGNGQGYQESAMSGGSGYGYLPGRKQGVQIMSYLEDTPSGITPPDNQSLIFLPCQDSAEMALINQRQLYIPRHTAISLGQSAVTAIESGHYTDANGKQIDWRESVQQAIDSKISIPPDKALPCPPIQHRHRTRIQVVNENTLVTARRVTQQGPHPLVLNLANGVHPGGGFLNGARAQEETLFRSSALYATLKNDPMYKAHSRRELPDSSDWVIYSPHVPVFRDEMGIALDHPWLMNVITCAAPYAPTVGQPTSSTLLRQRIHRILFIARSYGYRSLILGAWGCGAFGNDAEQTARDFRLAFENAFCGDFEHVWFSISDWSPERRFLKPFAETFRKSYTRDK